MLRGKIMRAGTQYVRTFYTCTVIKAGGFALLAKAVKLIKKIIYSPMCTYVCILKEIAQLKGGSKKAV
jgi:hypothetical protein